MGNRSRVLLVDISQLLGDMISTFAQEREDVDMLGTVGDEQVTAAVARTGANVVVVSTGQESLPTGCRGLLEERGDLRVVAVVGDERRGCVYVLRPHRYDIDTLTPTRLLMAITGSDS